MVWKIIERTSRVEEIETALLKKYVGGAALGAKILYDEVPPRTDPLGTENKLIFTVAPLTGTETPCTSRVNVSTKSPLTGTLANSVSGGFIPLALESFFQKKEGM